MKDDDFDSLVKESRARSLNEEARTGAELDEDKLFSFVSESVQHRETLTGVDALTAHVDGSKAFHEEAEDKQMKALLERLDREIVVSSSVAQQGDFRINNVPAPGHHIVTVSGNTYEVKDQLKKLGFRFDPRSKMWTMKATVSDFRGRRGPSDKTMKSAEQKVRDLAATMNKKWRDEDEEQLKAAGHSKMRFPKDPKGMSKMVDANGRIHKAFEKKGVKVEYTKRGTVEFTGNTYPLRNVFKKNQFAWRGGAWVMRFDNYAIVQERFFKEAMQALKSVKAPQQDTEVPAPDVGINKRLRHFKHNKQFYIDQRRAEKDSDFAEVFADQLAAGMYDESIDNVDPNDRDQLFESLMHAAEMPIEEAKETFKAAKSRILDFLKKDGWDVSSSIKVPKAVDKYAGKVIYFKAQSVYAGSFSPRDTPNSIGQTRSMWVDIRGMSGEDFLRTVDKFLG